MEKIKRGIVVALMGVVSLVGVSESTAQQVNVNSDFALRFEDGTLADLNTEIILGRTTDFSALADLLLMDPGSLESSMLFSEYGRANVGDAGLNGATGLFFFGTANTDTSFFDVDTQIILIARNLTLPTVEVGLYSNPDWIFPDNGIGTSTASISTRDVLADNGIIGLGKAGGAIDTDFGPSELSLHMRAIPEPSTYLLVGVGLFSLVAARRRS